MTSIYSHTSDGTATIKIPRNDLNFEREMINVSIGDRDVVLLMKQGTVSSEQFTWDDAAIRLFFDKYFSNRGLCGKKPFVHKKLYSAIAADMQEHGYCINAQQVCNKYKSLERSFKNYTATMNKTGRGRRILPYET
jgi:hypothetical protein